VRELRHVKVRNSFICSLLGLHVALSYMNTYDLNPGIASPQQRSSQSLASAAIVSVTGLTVDNTHLCSQV